MAASVIESNERFTDAWANHHRFLLDVAYRLLGSYNEAEDLVQEAFSRLLRTDLDPIEDVRAWLVVVVSRLCLDQLRSARVKREAHVGPWFPEPLLSIEDAATDPADVVTMDESVRFALLVVLERMSPAERVVFVLHDVFDFPFDRIAPMVGRTVTACRQLAARGRRRVADEAGSARFEVDPVEQRRVVDAFIAACKSGDIQALLALLDPSVMGWADISRAGGGLARLISGLPLAGISQPNVGREIVGERVMRIFGAGSGNTLIERSVNGEPSVVVLFNGSVVAVVALSVKDHLVTRVYVVSDERKLRQVKRVLGDR